MILNVLGDDFVPPHAYVQALETTAPVQSYNDDESTPAFINKQAQWDQFFWQKMVQAINMLINKQAQWDQFFWQKMVQAINMLTNAPQIRHYESV